MRDKTKKGLSFKFIACNFVSVLFQLSVLVSQSGFLHPAHSQSSPSVSVIVGDGLPEVAT